MKTLSSSKYLWRTKMSWNFYLQPGIDHQKGHNPSFQKFSKGTVASKLNKPEHLGPYRLQRRKSRTAIDVWSITFRSLPTFRLFDFLRANWWRRPLPSPIRIDTTQCQLRSTFKLKLNIKCIKIMFTAGFGVEAHKNKADVDPKTNIGWKNHGAPVVCVSARHKCILSVVIDGREKCWQWMSFSSANRTFFRLDDLRCWKVARKCWNMPETSWNRSSPNKLLLKQKNIFLLACNCFTTCPRSKQKGE